MLVLKRPKKWGSMVSYRQKYTILKELVITKSLKWTDFNVFKNLLEIRNSCRLFFLFFFCFQFEFSFSDYRNSDSSLHWIHQNTTYCVCSEWSLPAASLAPRCPARCHALVSTFSLCRIMSNDLLKLGKYLEAY